MREGKTSDNFVMGLLCGAAVGTAVGLLLAPKAGSELRHQIYESGGRLKQSAADGYTAAAGKVSTVVGDLVERGKKAAQRGQDTYTQVRQSAGEVADAAADAVNDRL